MSDSDNNLPTQKRSDAGRAHFPMDDARREKFIEGVRKFVSFRAAARYATPGATDCTSSFRREMAVNPDFKAAVMEAVDEGLGALEEIAVDRITTPDVRRQFDPKTGRLIGESFGYEPANRMLRAVLAHHDDSWVDKKQLDTTNKTTVTHIGQGNGGGPGVTLPFEDVQKYLSLEERGQLTDLLRLMMSRKEASQEQENQPAALPSPDQPETQQDGID